MELRLEDKTVCNVQARLFRNAALQGFDSENFIRFFLNSSTAAHLDNDYDFFQWAGEEYLLDELNDEAGGLKKGGIIYSDEAMYWIGYLCRYWHYLTGISSKEIGAQIPEKLLIYSYPGLHTFDPDEAIFRIKEISQERQNPGMRAIGPDYLNPTS